MSFAACNQSHLSEVSQQVLISDLQKKVEELKGEVQTLKQANESINDELIKCKSEKKSFHDNLSQCLDKNRNMKSQLLKFERYAQGLKNEKQNMIDTIKKMEEN